MTNEETKGQNASPEQDGDTGENISIEAMGDWAAQQAAQIAGKSRAQRRWTQKNADDQHTAETESVPEGNLAELGELFEEVGGSESEEETRSKSVHSRTSAHFGVENSATIVVGVTTGEHEAIVYALSLDSQQPPPEIEELKQVLESEFGVVYGIDEEQLHALLKGSLDGEPIDDEVVVACSTPAEVGEDGWISYPSSEGEEMVGMELHEALKKETAKEVLSTELTTHLVCPGEVLAKVVLPTPGKAGRTVLGEIIAQPGRPPDPIEMGEYVIYEDGQYKAEIYGYGCMLENTLHVVSPIWISPDRMLAAFLRFRQKKAGSKPDSGWIIDLLKEAGVRHGIIEPAIEQLCQGEDQSGRLALVLARGTPLKHGNDARLEFGYDAEVRPGKVREDGSIEFRDRNIIIGVQEGALLVENVPATRGKNGMNILAEELEGKDGEVPEFTSGEGVRVEEEEVGPEELGSGLRRFYATCEGSVSCTEGKIEVLPVMSINGDVDFSVGHIETKGDVAIGGSVLYGYDIQCVGSVVIGGGLENGVKIQVGGDVVISQGIVGEDTTVIAGGNIECKLVQNARVMAQGDILVGNSLVNAHVQAGGTIVVNTVGSKLAGSIVGGETVATVGIEAKYIGSPGLEPVRVGCHASPSAQARLRDLHMRAASAQKQIDNNLAVLGVVRLERELINEALAQVPLAERAPLVAAFKEAYQSAQSLVELQKEIARETEEHQAAIAAGTIKVSDSVYPEVWVAFGGKSLRIDEKRPGCLFSLGEEGIEERGAVESESESEPESEPESESESES